jgi:hypothetical protein
MLIRRYFLQYPCLENARDRCDVTLMFSRLSAAAQAAMILPACRRACRFGSAARTWVGAAARPFATALSVPRSQPRPTEPAPEECCGNGCERCVWTTYWEELAEWEAAQPPAVRAADCAVLEELASVTQDVAHIAVTDALASVPVEPTQPPPASGSTPPRVDCDAPAEPAFPIRAVEHDTDMVATVTDDASASATASEWDKLPQR